MSPQNWYLASGAGFAVLANLTMWALHRWELRLRKREAIRDETKEGV